MKYNQTYNRTKSIFPQIIHYFSMIPDELIHSSEHKNPLKHPGAIFNVAYSKIITDISKYLNLRNNLNATIENDSRNKLTSDIVEVIESLIYNLCSFYDDAYSILVTLSEPSINNPNFAYDWLKANGYSNSADYLKSYKHCMELWINIVNRLKHNNQKLERISIFDGTVIISGFFVEGVSSDGSITPDPSIHSDMLKSTFGLSFERTVLMIFFTFYYLSDKLLVSVKKHLKDYYNFEFDKISLKYTNDEEIVKIWKELSNTKYFFFPEEYKLKFPKITITGNLYKISYPHGDKIYQPKKFQTSITYTADGYSNKFNFPGNP